MAGANYMGGKRNTARTRSKDSRGRAEKHHFGRKRVELLQKSLAAPQSTTPAESSTQQHATLPVELDHALRDKGQRTENSQASYEYPQTGSGKTRSKRISCVIAAMDSDPTSISYRSAVSEILRISNTTGLSGLRGLPKPLSALTSGRKTRSSNHISESSGSMALNSVSNKQDESGFVEASSDVGDDIEPAPFAFDPNDERQDDGHGESSPVPSSRAGSSRESEDTRSALQARYEQQIVVHTPPSHIDRELTPRHVGSLTAATTPELGVTSRSPPRGLSPAPSIDSSRVQPDLGLSNVHTVHPLAEVPAGPLLSIGDLLGEPDAWDAAGMALGFPSSQQSEPYDRPAMNGSTNVSVPLDAGSYLNIPPTEVSADMDIDWDILDHDGAAVALARPYIDTQTAAGPKLLGKEPSELRRSPALDASGPVPLLADIGLEALFPDDVDTHAVITRPAEIARTPVLPRANVLSSKPAPIASGVTLSHPPLYQFTLHNKTPAPISTKPLSKLRAPARPALPKANAQISQATTPPQDSTAAPRELKRPYNAIDQGPRAPTIPLIKSFSNTSKTPVIPSTAHIHPSSSQLEKRLKLYRNPEPLPPAPADAFLDSLFDDVMPNLEPDSPVPRPNRPSTAFELF